jgi:hypothetical protein
MPFLNTRNDLLFARPAPFGRIIFSQCTILRARRFFPALQIPMPRITSLPSAHIPYKTILLPRPSGEETGTHFPSLLRKYSDNFPVGSICAPGKMTLRPLGRKHNTTLTQNEA